MKPAPTLLSGTFIGSSVGLQVGRRALERLRDGGYYGPDGRIAKLHEAFRDRARKLVDDHPDWFPEVPHPLVLRRQATGVYGGTGGMMRLTPFGGDKNKMIKTVHKLYEHGVISFYCGHGPYHLRFLPPVGVMQPKQFDDVFAIIEKAFAEVAKEE
jgi:4-aminobutyrate aminotransferase-like enzyme